MRISDWSSDVCSSDLALLRFQKSGKPIIAYGEFYSQTAYYLASVADKIYLHPEGSLDFGGLGSEVIFFTGLLEKLDIVPQRSEEHTSELQSLMRISYAVFCLKKKKIKKYIQKKKQ